MDRYIDPLVGHLKAMLNYRKFRKGTKAEVDDILRIEKQEIPNRIAYCFGISHEHPGTFIITHIRNTTPHHELVGLYPKGFKFRKRMFDNIDRLVAYFQKHINDPLHESLSIQSVTARVPMRSPAPGGSSGGWGGPGGGDGGWRGPSPRDHSSRGGRTGRNDYRNGGHPSGTPRPPYEVGRGRERERERASYSGSRDGSRFDRPSSGYGGGSRWSSDDNKDGNSKWETFPGAKVHNAPGEEAFPGGWGSSGVDAPNSARGSGSKSGSKGW